jgi:hypothetical protein
VRPAFGDARRIFLADGDALAAPQEELLALLALLRRHFPKLQRVGMYANAGSILGKSVEELSCLREQGLGILYSALNRATTRCLPGCGKERLLQIWSRHPVLSKRRE